MATTSVSSSDNPAANIYESLNGSKKNTTTGPNSMTEAQNRFLTLLTTQLKYQDPLSPMDNAQMTSQMAQINMVSGIEKLNMTLSKMIDTQGQTEVLQAASLVGHGVLVPGKSLALDKGIAGGGYELESDADSVAIEVLDSNGLLVRNLNYTGQKAGVQEFVWDGKTNSGTAAADGKYTFSVTAKQGKDKVTVNPLTFGQVTAVVRNAAGLTVDVGALGNFVVSDVKQIL
jgi:flagellar basal-body rod modification protein FlgD